MSRSEAVTVDPSHINKSTPPHFIAEPNSYDQTFYRRNNGRLAIALLFSVVTLGIWPLICYYCKRHLWIKFVYTVCEPATCSLVTFVEHNSKKVHIFNVQYFTPDGLELRPVRLLQDGLIASDYACPRIDVGDGWWLYYDDVTKSFMRYEGPTSSSRGPSSLNNSQRAFSKLTQLDDDHQHHQHHHQRRNENRSNDREEHGGTATMMDVHIAQQLENGPNWLNKGNDDENELVGYQQVAIFKFLLYVEFVISAGIFWIFCYWQPYIQLHLTHRRCNLLAADTILAMSPANKAKKQRDAAEIFPPWLYTLFSTGLVHIVLLFIPLGFFAMLGFVIALHIILRPYTVRSVKHTTRDGQLVKLAVSKARLVGYFRGTSCSEAAVIKFFTWQKVKYVWSGVTVLDENHDGQGHHHKASRPSSRQIIVANRFERQTGLVAPDDIDPKSTTARGQALHQVMGITPTISYLQSQHGLTHTQVALISSLLGRNTMDLPLTPLFVVFLREILSPFYIFQIFSVTVWLCDGYMIYAYVIIGLSAVSMIWQIITIRLGEVALRKTMHKPSQVEVLRRPTDTSSSGSSSAKIMMVEPDQLVPGDVIVIPPGGCILQCDAAILSGTCLVDEAMLTGESVPVLKFALPPLKNDADDDELLQIRKNERSLLFCGTRVLQANSQGSQDGKIRAVVIRTGFMTAKGELTRLILYPKPLDFEFAVDAVKFVGVMAAIAFAGLCYSIALRVYRHEKTQVIVLRSLDIITIAVPPALPIALTIGYMMAQRRLQRRHVFCTSPSAINVAGVVDVVCMDKTGTMTEGGLDFEKLLPVKDGHFITQAAPASLTDGHLLRCLVSCHSLALVDGKAIGDPIEEKMFQLADWRVKQAEPDQVCTVGSTLDTFSPIMIVCPPEYHSHGAPPLGIVRQLPFSSHFQRMSVVACPVVNTISTPSPAHRNEGMSLYLKGAPEVVVGLCRFTTLPADLDLHLGALTENGYRVLGLATKPLARYGLDDILSADRDELERDLDFLGFLVFENKLKPETFGVIDKLKKAKLRVIMLTGDNALTAVSVARQAGVIEDNDQVLIVNACAPAASLETDNNRPVLDYIEIKKKFGQTQPVMVASPPPPPSVMPRKNGERVPSYILDMLPITPARAVKLVVTGASWAVLKEHFPEEIDRILLRGAVFARVNPNQKKEVIEGLQRLGLYALMCGDGANDCGALRAACTGVSLSQAEASVASPFTSKIENISCIHLLIREGRCALVTSFSIFRFMLLYAFIQFMSCWILYYAKANLSQYGFLYADLFLATSLVFTMSFTEAYDHLVAEKPPSSLLEIQPLLSIVLQGILIVSFQILSYLYLMRGSHTWFIPFNPPPQDTETYYCFEYYAVFLISVFQYPCIAIVLSKGVPFRKPMFTNWAFCLNLAINIGANLFLCFDPSPPFPKTPEGYTTFGQILTLALPPSMQYRGIVFLFAFIFCFASLLTELIFVERSWLSKALQRCFQSLSHKQASRRKYEVLEEQLGNGVDAWPPVSRSPMHGGALTLLTHEGQKQHNNNGTATEGATRQREPRPLPRLPPSASATAATHNNQSRRTQNEMDLSEPITNSSSNNATAIGDALFQLAV